MPADEPLLTWQGQPLGPTGIICVVGDRGPARTQATLALAARAPRPGGSLTIVGHAVGHRVGHLPRAVRRASVVTRADGLDVIDTLATAHDVLRTLSEPALDSEAARQLLASYGIPDELSTPWHSLSARDQILGALAVAEASGAAMCVVDDTLDGLTEGARADAERALTRLAASRLVITSACSAPAGSVAIATESVVPAASASRP